MLSTLLLALPLGLPAPSAPSAPAPAGEGPVARIELERGRALLVRETGVVPVRRHFGAQVSPGPGHLELAPASRAVVRWAGLASLTLTGPTSVSWQELTPGQLLWRFSALHGAEVEIRGGTARIELPDAWRVEVGRGAFSFHGLPGGGVELVHQAGTSLQARWIGEETSCPPPVTLGPGDRARLAGAPRLEVTTDASAATPRWTRTAWPWGRGGIPDVPDLTRDSGAPWPAEAWPWGPGSAEMKPWERWDWPWGSSATERAPEPERGGPTAPPEAGESVESPNPIEPPEPAEPTGRSADPAAAEPRPSEAAPHPWRGLPEELLERHSGLRLERSDDWRWEELPSGRRRVQLDPRATRPRWVFAPELDLRLFPGAAVVTEADGRFCYHEGWVRLLAAPPERDRDLDSGEQGE